MASSIIDEDDQDDLVMQLEYEDNDSSEESDEDDGEVGEEANNEDGREREMRGIVAWEYEPLPRGEPGENIGDAEAAHAENRLHINVDEW